MSEIRTLLDRVKSGGRLREAERLDLLEALDTGEYTADQLAAMCGVSARQIRRDRAKLRERYAKALQDLAIAGELFREYRATLERIDRAIFEGDYAKVRALALRWGVCEGFGKLAIHHQLGEIEKLIEELKKLKSLTWGGSNAVN
jgi:hypothetical protein